MASPVAVCDRLNRHPKHRFNRWSLELLHYVREANGYFGSESDRMNRRYPMQRHRFIRWYADFC